MDLQKLGWVRKKDGACAIVQFVATDQTKPANDLASHTVHYRLRYRGSRRVYESRADRFLKAWENRGEAVEAAPEAEVPNAQG